MSQAGVWWRERGSDALEGPFTDAQVRKMVTDGVVAGSDRLWSPHFGWMSVAEQITPARAAPRWGGILASAGLALASLAYWSLMALHIDLLYATGASRFPSHLLSVLWPLTGVGLAAASLVAALLWWRFTKRPGCSVELAGMIRIAAVALLLAGGAIAGRELSLSGWVVRQSAATADWNYRIQLGPRGDKLLVDGLIGTGFGDEMKRRLRAHRTVRQVEISSPGGMINEAMKAAKATAESGVTVVVRGGCRSACLIVLMAADERLGDHDGWLAFHATAPIAETKSKFLDWAMQKEGRASDSYLIGRGVPPDVIAETRRRGPSSLYYMSTIDALDRGILTGLVDGDRPVSRDEALRLLKAAEAQLR